MNTRPKIIAIDFDGTCVTHEYPWIGREIGAVPVLKRLVAAGHKLILYTMRSNEKLHLAEMWFKDRCIPLYGVNTNPTQLSWTMSPKAHAEIYIDDAALGCPLKHNPPERPYVDWGLVELMLQSRGVLPYEVRYRSPHSPNGWVMYQSQDPIESMCRLLDKIASEGCKPLEQPYRWGVKERGQNPG